MRHSSAFLARLRPRRPFRHLAVGEKAGLPLGRARLPSRGAGRASRCVKVVPREGLRLGQAGLRGGRPVGAPWRLEVAEVAGMPVGRGNLHGSCGRGSAGCFEVGAGERVSLG